MKKPSFSLAFFVIAAICLLLSAFPATAQTSCPLQKVRFTGPGAEYRQCSDRPQTVTYHAEQVDVTFSGGIDKRGDYDSYNQITNIQCPFNNFQRKLEIHFSRPVYNLDISLVNGISYGTFRMPFTVTPDVGPPVVVTFAQRDSEHALFTNNGVSHITITADPSPFSDAFTMVIEEIQFKIDCLIPPPPVENPFKAPTATDTHFREESMQAGIASTCLYRSSGPLLIKIPVDRVVGEVNSDGTLVDPQKLVNNGVLAPYAALRLPSFDVNYGDRSPPYQPERDHILFNGVEIGTNGAKEYLTGQANKWALNVFSVPIELVRFGKRNKGGRPTPSENVIEIRIDEDNTNQKERWCTSVAWAALHIGTLAPVVMVHGNNSCGNFFAGDLDCNGAPDMPSDQYFTRRFEELGIQYDNSINMTTAGIGLHALGLYKGALAGVPNIRPIKDVAAEFGAKHVHIIAHSKGGLDVREFLTLLASGDTPGDLGVFSLSTLSTPHMGSVGADYQEDAASLSLMGINLSDSRFRAGLARALGTDPGKPDLRVEAVQRFNWRNIPSLPRWFTIDDERNPMTYFALSADANLDDSVAPASRPTNYLPTITAGRNGTIDETVGVPYVPVRNLRLGKGWLYTRVYRMMGMVQQTELEQRPIPLTFGYATTAAIKEVREQIFQLNDFAVTEQSAWASPFLWGINFYGTNRIKANHATLSNPGTADIVIGWIRLAQPLKY